MIRGELVKELTESGAVRVISKEFLPLPEDEQRSVAYRVQHRLAA
jgi:hypothetical protein